MGAREHPTARIGDVLSQPHAGRHGDEPEHSLPLSMGPPGGARLWLSPLSAFVYSLVSLSRCRHVDTCTRLDFSLVCRSFPGRPVDSHDSIASPKWGLARSRLRGFWSGFVLTGVSPASCSKRPDVAVRSARHEAGGYGLFIKL